MRRCQRLPEVTHPGDPPRPETHRSIPVPGAKLLELLEIGLLRPIRRPRQEAPSTIPPAVPSQRVVTIVRFRRTHGGVAMKKLFGSAGASAGAAVLAAAVTAALMTAVRPAAAQEPRVALRSFGSASIGVSIRDVTGEDAVKAKIAQPAGVYVETVTEGSPASKAGLQAGDIVVD